jgi:hypothetical protein
VGSRKREGIATAKPPESFSAAPRGSHSIGVNCPDRLSHSWLSARAWRPPLLLATDEIAQELEEASDVALGAAALTQATDEEAQLPFGGEHVATDARHKDEARWQSLQRRLGVDPAGVELAVDPLVDREDATRAEGGLDRVEETLLG